jgi:hypothetical protein
VIGVLGQVAAFRAYAPGRIVPPLNTADSSETTSTGSTLEMLGSEPQRSVGVSSFVDSAASSPCAVAACSSGVEQPVAERPTTRQAADTEK